jgi:replication factor C subunit 2/4
MSGGDMRKAITVLQSAAALYGSTITAANVLDMSGVFPDSEVAAAMAALKGTFDGARRQAIAVINSGYGLDSVLEKVGV